MTDADESRGMRRRRTSFAGLLALVVLIGGGCRGVVETVPEGEPPIVQLRYTTLPDPVDAVAVHYWFVAWMPGRERPRRTEIWRRGEWWNTLDGSPERGGDLGHLRADNGDPDWNMGSGPTVIHKEWRGDEAWQLIDVLDQPERYPDRRTYWVWPGPNSNTWAAFVLREAGLGVDLDPRAVGKDWRGFVSVGPTASRTGVSFDTPLLGLGVGLDEGLELRLLALTFGVDLWPPALKTPFGRLGFSDTVGELDEDRRRERRDRRRELERLWPEKPRRAGALMAWKRREAQRKRSARQRFKWRRERLRREALGLDPDPPWPTGIPVFGTSFISGRIDNIVDGDGPSLTGRRLNGTR